MKLKWNNLMDEAGKGDGGGSGGTLLNGGEGGGSGGTGEAGNKSGTGGGSGGNGGDAGTKNAGTNTDWRASLPKEMQEDASLKKFTSLEALAGSYVNLQKQIGGDKIIIPGKHATEEDWKNVYHKLGVPEKVEEYSVKFKEGFSLDEKFATDFKTHAHKLGILPKQAQALADWFSDVNIGAEKAVQVEFQKAYEASVANLKKDWGNAFELNVSRANKVLKELGGKEVADYFVKSGLANDEKIVRLLAKAGEELYKEHKIVENQGTAGAMSPKEIDAEIKKLQADPAYYDKMHPNHKAIVQDVKELYEKRYPTVDKK